MDTVIQEQLLISKSYFKSRDFNTALKFLNDVSDQEDIYVKINQCILLDWLNRDDELISIMHQVTKKLNEIECNDDRIWWVAVFLNHKLQRSSDAIFCIDHLLKLTKKRDIRIEAIIRKGYCLEALYDFDQAIDLFHKVLNDKPKETYKYLPEINHGLGHFYNERGNIKKSISDINKAEQYMKEAARLNPTFYPCWGTIYSENKNYHKALEIFDQALKNPDIDDSIMNEILFYKAEALSWIGKYPEAYNLFEKFEDYCEKYNNRDGKVHSIVYRIETQLREKSIFEINSNEIESWINLLNNNKPSHYANKAIHDEWDKLIHLSNGLYSLKQFLQDKTTINQVYDKIINEMSYFLDKDLMVVMYLCDTPPMIEKYSTMFNLRSIPESYTENDLRLLDDTDTILVALFETIPIELILLVQQHLFKGNTVALWYDKSKIQMVKGIERKALLFDDLQNALKIAFLLSVYDEIKKNLIKPFFLFGMAPISQAPSYSAQVGWINNMVIPGED